MSKYRDTLIERLGSVEAYNDFIRSRGSKGGKSGDPAKKGWTQRKKLIELGVPVKPVDKGNHPRKKST